MLIFPDIFNKEMGRYHVSVNSGCACNWTRNINQESGSVSQCDDHTFIIEAVKVHHQERTSQIYFISDGTHKTYLPK